MWVETQVVQFDPVGRYEVHLGAMSASGLPTDLFSNGEARWLEVQVAGSVPAPRVLLASVPYALNAATLGGLPASAFVLAGSQVAALAAAGATSAGGSVTSDTNSTVTTTGGTSHYLPLFTGTSTIANSEIYDTGSSVGIGDVPASSAKLDVKGAIITRGSLTLSPTSTANASHGYSSFGADFSSSVYNSSTKTAATPFFQLQSEPVSNNTSNPSATFNLLYAAPGKGPAETGLSINSTGVIHFASGQTFPGGGGSGITKITAASPLTGGGTTGNVTIGLSASALETTPEPDLCAAQSLQLLHFERHLRRPDHRATRATPCMPSRATPAPASAWKAWPRERTDTVSMAIPRAMAVSASMGTRTAVLTPTAITRSVCWRMRSRVSA